MNENNDLINEKYKLNKYKMKMDNIKIITNSELITKINNIIDNNKYIIKLITTGTLKYFLDNNCESCINLQIGDTIYKYVKIFNSIVEKDNIIDNYLFSNIIDSLKNNNFNQEDLLADKYDNLLKTQIIFGFMYLNKNNIKQFKLKKIQLLNKFTKTILMMVLDLVKNEINIEENPN